MCWISSTNWSDDSTRILGSKTVCLTLLYNRVQNVCLNSMSKFTEHSKGGRPWYYPYRDSWPTFSAFFLVHLHLFLPLFFYIFEKIIWNETRLGTQLNFMSEHSKLNSNYLSTMEFWLVSSSFYTVWTGSKACFQRFELSIIENSNRYAFPAIQNDCNHIMQRHAETLVTFKICPDK